MHWSLLQEGESGTVHSTDPLAERANVIFQERACAMLPGQSMPGVWMASVQKLEMLKNWCQTVVGKIHLVTFYIASVFYMHFKRTTSCLIGVSSLLQMWTYKILPRG